VSRWREFAAELGVIDDEIALMAPAFEHEASTESADRIGDRQVIRRRCRRR
jgi:Mn-dependent DtxR family transcriptional regulator